MRTNVNLKDNVIRHPAWMDAYLIRPRATRLRAFRQVLYALLAGLSAVTLVSVFHLNGFVTGWLLCAALLAGIALDDMIEIHEKGGNP